MADQNIKYTASAALTIGLASLGSSATHVAGRESTAISNTTNLFPDVMVAGKITTGTSPTVNTTIRIYGYAAIDDTPTYPDVLDGTDSAETFTSVNVRNSAIKLARVITVDATSDRTYFFAPFSIAWLFGHMPTNWGIFVAHNTGVALNSTAGNHFIKYDGIEYTIA